LVLLHGVAISIQGVMQQRYKKTIAGMSYGAVIAGIALYLVSSGLLGALGVLAAPVIIAVTVFFSSDCCRLQFAFCGAS